MSFSQSTGMAIGLAKAAVNTVVNNTANLTDNAILTSWSEMASNFGDDVAVPSPVTHAGLLLGGMALAAGVGYLARVVWQGGADQGVGTNANIGVNVDTNAAVNVGTYLDARTKDALILTTQGQNASQCEGITTPRKARNAVVRRQQALGIRGEREHKMRLEKIEKQEAAEVARRKAMVAAVKAGRSVNGI